MPRLRKKWPRQRRAWFIVPAGRRGRGPGRADPAGRPWRGNPHSPPWEARAEASRGCLSSARPRARRRSLAGSAGEPPSPGKEGGASAARGDAGLRASGRGECARRGRAGALQPPALAFLPPSPAPSPPASAERPPRAPAPAGQGRSLRARSRLPHAPAAPPPGSGAPSRVGQRSLHEPPLRRQLADCGRMDAAGSALRLGESAWPRTSLAPGPASRSSECLSWGWGRGRAHSPLPGSFGGGRPLSAGLVAEEDDWLSGLVLTPVHSRRAAGGCPGETASAGIPLLEDSLEA